MKATAQMRIPLSRSEIIRVKTKALRRGVWYRVLTRVERACVDLVIRVVERIRSGRLARVMSSILRKLEEAMESRVRRLIHEIGSNLASKLGQIAQKWGNRQALHWAKDADFMQYLTITHLNAPP